jgi:squalene synthase HpnC
MAWNASRSPVVRDPAAWTLVGADWSQRTSSEAEPTTLLSQPEPPSLADAEAFCRKIATGHYENFSVLSWLVPRQLRQDFANVYAFARWSDDLADESADPRSATAALGAWRGELDACARQGAVHPILVALTATMQRCELEPTPFYDLLDAFVQDQQVVRYETRDQLVDYCRRSANPVGRIVLALAGCRDPQRLAESDAICTGLQLVNFWQDIRRDREAGRIYLPQADMDQHGVEEADLDAPSANPRLKTLVRDEVRWAESWFDAGEPLLRLAPRSLRPAITAFSGGGRAVAQAIHRSGYDTLARRPVVSKAKKLSLAVGAVLRRFTASLASGAAPSKAVGR